METLLQYIWSLWEDPIDVCGIVHGCVSMRPTVAQDSVLSSSIYSYGHFECSDYKRCLLCQGIPIRG